MENKKITRGINKEFAEKFIKSELYQLYKKHNDELIIGVRNNSLNLYYNCDSIAKISCINNSLRCEIDRYYTDGIHYKINDKNKKYEISQNEICDKYDKIKENSNKKQKNEKKAQSNLFIKNNSNELSNWFCIDIEYVKSFNDKNEKNESNFSARFDIIAISKKEISKEEGHVAALIELKYGNSSIGGNSGIYKHANDFFKFKDKNYFEDHLKGEIFDIIESQKDIGINIPFNELNKESLLTYKFYFIILNNNSETENFSTPKQTMAGYLFRKKKWGCKRLSKKYCVENDFGDITKKENIVNATFLFSKWTLDNLSIEDIIDGDYDEIITPM